MPTFEEVLRAARAAVPGAAPRDRRVPGDQAPDVLPGHRAAAGGAAGGGAAPARAGPPGRAGVRAVLRGGQPARAAADAPAAGAAGVPDRRAGRPVRRPAHVRRVPDPGRAAPSWPASSTASGRRRTRSSRARPTARWARRPALVADAHAAGLVVHPYTFRAENQFLPANLRVGTDPTAYGRAIDEQRAFLRRGHRRPVHRPPRHRRPRPHPAPQPVISRSPVARRLPCRLPSIMVISGWFDLRMPRFAHCSTSNRMIDGTAAGRAGAAPRASFRRTRLRATARSWQVRVSS